MSIKNFKELIKKEDYVPYVAILVIILASIGSLLENYLNEIEKSTELENPLTLALIGIASVSLLIVVIFAIKRAIQHDFRKAKEKKDERALLHDWQVTKKGYNILIYGLCFYLVFLPSSAATDLFLVGLLIFIIIYRILVRAKLEKEN